MNLSYNSFLNPSFSVSNIFSDNKNTNKKENQNSNKEFGWLFG